MPAKIFLEKRNSVRASIATQSAILRLPTSISEDEKIRHTEWFETWVRKKLQDNPKLQQRFFPAAYKDGQQVKVLDRTFTLRIKKTSNINHSARLQDDIIWVYLAKKDLRPIEHVIRNSISKMSIHTFLPRIKERVFELNDLHFQKPIASVRMMHTDTRWGSCSSSGNITLSSRLLLAPPEVIDYVIIHELAHLIEDNHSPKFWKLVEKAMPDYQKKSAWLKANHEQCRF